MAQLKQGAPGVRIRLRDVSEVTLVTSPNIVGGIVGFSAKGEFNKIMKLNSTSDVDVNLGSGYNNPRYNQGLYAARSVLTAGGFVEYVRPYGEVVVQDDTSPLYPYNQELKTDTYFVTYDFSEDVNLDRVRPDSFDINYWASTRYVQDAYGSYGSRQINTISETIVSNSNIDFSLNVDNMPDGEGGTSKVGLFSIMNTDPTAANRAADKYDISNISSASANVSFNISTIQGLSPTIPYIIKVVTSTPHMLVAGDSVAIAGTGVYDVANTGAVSILNKTTFTFTSDLIDSTTIVTTGTISYDNLTVTVITKNNNLVSNGDSVVIGGTVNYNNSNAVVVNRVTQKRFEYSIHTLGITGFPAENSGAVFLNLDSVASGVDSLLLKTAARGGSSKYFDKLSLNSIPTTNDKFGFIKPTGDTITFEFQPTGVDNSDGTTRVPIIAPNVTGSGFSANITNIVSDGTSIITSIHGGVDIISISGDGTTVTATLSSTLTLGIGSLISIAGTTSYNIPSVALTGVTGNIVTYLSAVATPAETVGIANKAVSPFLITANTGSNNFISTDTLAVSGTILYNQSAITPLSIISPTKFVYSSTISATATENSGKFVRTSGNTVTLTTNVPTGMAIADTFSVSGTVSYNTASAAISTISGNVITFTSASISSIIPETTGLFTSLVNPIQILLDSSANVMVNDLVSFTASNGDITSGAQYVVSAISGNYIYVNDTITFTPAILATPVFNATMNNLSGTLRSVQNAVKNEGYIYNPIRTSFNVQTGIQSESSIFVTNVNKFGVGDIITVFNHFDASGLYPVSNNGLVNGGYYVIAGVNVSGSIITIKSIDLTTGITSNVSLTNAISGSTALFINLTQTNGGASWVSDGVGGASGAYVPQLLNSTWLGLKTPVSYQELNVSVFVSEPTSPIQNNLTVKLAITNDGILIDNSVGADFLSLGIATDAYVDTNFDGIQEKVYLLTDIGRQVARIYLYVSYFFAGNSFVFSGTVIPFAVNETNLSIAETANSVAVGWKYVPNDNSSVQNSVQNSAFDLSQSQSGNIIQANWTQIAFNSTDPAILNNAIWEYDPNKNNSTLTFAGAWQLFLDKDLANSDMLIAAGTAIVNLFVKGREELNYDVMNVMLDVCEKRKDLFAIFDGVNESNINKCLAKMVGIGGNGDLARWGGIYDGRSLFFDSAYTKLVVEAVQTIPLASIITSNRIGNSWWLPPAGYDTGRMPAQWSRSQLYTRTYKYADDSNSDIARLYDANINPIRVNDQGQFVYGQKTMLKRTSALNRMNVIMLIAGIHKRFANYLDTKVFQLNTAALRSNIQADLQASLNSIQSANPAGITAGLVICDTTNNPPIIIDTNQLIVDVTIQPTRSTEFITLRTTVQRTGADLNVSTSTIIGG